MRGRIRMLRARCCTNRTVILAACVLSTWAAPIQGRNRCLAEHRRLSRRRLRALLASWQRVVGYSLSLRRRLAGMLRSSARRSRVFHFAQWKRSTDELGWRRAILRRLLRHEFRRSAGCAWEGWTQCVLRSRIRLLRVVAISQRVRRNALHEVWHALQGMVRWEEGLRRHGTLLALLLRRRLLRREWDVWKGCCGPKARCGPEVAGDGLRPFGVGQGDAGSPPGLAIVRAR